MKVGIIGSGNIAHVYAPLILAQPSVTVVGVVDQARTRAQALAARVGAPGIYQDARQMLAETELDLVHVLTPPHTHADLSILAMDHGCHVLVEKPMALTVADAQRMVAAAERNGVLLCVNHNMVVQDVVQRARDLIAAGRIGSLASVEATYAFNATRTSEILEEGAEHCHWTYRLNGGPLQDQMPHPASLLMAFLPDIQEVHALTENRGILPPGWPDEARILVRSSGPFGSIDLSFSERPDTISLTCKGTAGIIQANLFSGILTVQRQSDLPRALIRGLSGFALAAQNLRESYRNLQRFASGRMDKSNGVGEVVAQFYAAVRSGSQPPISLQSSLRVVELIERLWPVPVVVDRSSDRRPQTPARRPATVLVTGASGFIGSHLVRKLLAEGVGVRALVRPDSPHAGRLAQSEAEVMAGDLSDARAIEKATAGIETIYHLGGVLAGDWQSHHRTNIQGTGHLIDAALAAGSMRFVFLSSLAVYELASLPAGAIVREDSAYVQDPWQMGPYAWSKLEAEKRILTAQRTQGLPATIVRPGIVIGPLGPIFYPHIGYRYKDRLFFLVSGGETVLPLTYVENTVDGICSAASATQAIGQIYNLVDDGAITAREYLDRYSAITGQHPRVVSVPYALPYWASAAFEVAGALGLVAKTATSRAQLKAKHRSFTFDNSKAKAELNWQPSVPIEEGLARTFAWYASQYGRAQVSPEQGAVPE